MIGHHKLNRKLAMRSLSYLAVLVALFGLAVLACGVESGDRRPARQGGSETLEFHRTPVTAMEQVRMNIAKDDTGCSIDPSEITVLMGQRVNMAIQLPTEIAQGATKSLEVVGEKQQLQFKIDGLEMTASGGAFWDRQDRLRRRNRVWRPSQLSVQRSERRRVRHPLR